MEMNSTSLAASSGDGVGEELPWYTTHSLLVSLMACGLTVFTMLIAFLHIRYHLRHYHEPVVQRHTIRIILMVPLYALMSCVSLFTYRTIVSFIATMLRDVYEAYTLYNFLALLLCLLGGPNVLVSKWKGSAHPASAPTTPGGKSADPAMPSSSPREEEEDELSSQFSWWTCTCCLKDLLKIDINNPRFLRMIRQGVMQFIYVKLVLAITSIVLKCVGLYGEGQIMNFKAGYIYIVVVYNLSIACALYSLMVFYMATKRFLKEHRPIFKFALVKIIIFVTFWQGLVVTILFKLDVIKPIKGLDATASAQFIVNFLICAEGVPLSILNVFGFWPSIVRKGKETNAFHSLKHCVRMNDVLMDTAHTFLPSQKYSEFVVINAQEGFQEDVEEPGPVGDGGEGGGRRDGDDDATQPPLIAIDAEMSHEQAQEAGTLRR